MPQKRVAVAMSGGVDSSLAAALLRAEGYQVIGITQQIWPSDKNTPEEKKFNGCCGLDAIESARRVAHKLGIPHYVMNFRDIFAQKVITDFHQEYRRGHTPNPCITCNQHVRFGSLLDKVSQLGIDSLATGHYARIKSSPNGYRLLKALDQTKDQSYFLYTLGQTKLRHLLFPLGNLHKTAVRRRAVELGLPSANREESQDICFVPDNDYRSFIVQYIPTESGDIIDTDGQVLGKHSGLAGYTVGQRHGLGITANEPRYVLKLDAAGNRVVVGNKDQLLNNKLLASKLSWVSGTPPPPTELINIKAKIRYRAPEAAVKLSISDGVAEIQFYQPQRAIAPGQAIVLYQGNTVLGGGIIEDT